ncbi:uncharacterized protein LOC123542352 isoform X2 [Mercenaria mercenaria]|uniref:uncharacterized protein LOC123542352 isoform X2 n=1 Tax=Mercenaria mercenaria TaxID=6596 RepID=UPI00234E64C0|nr:uncharacterized protein LOC123542352 isoform X2 [Mercenaria mercenaria]
MEKWTSLFLCLLLPFYGTDSSQPFGHMGCFDKNSFPERNNTYFLFTMTGTSCMEICRSVILRYAATKGHRCFCSKSISISPYTGSFKCNYTCPGNKTEICGGETSLSIYDTWDVQATIPSTTPNGSMKTTSEIMSTEQIDHNTAAVQTTFRSTTSNGPMEITSESASISTEQADLDTASVQTTIRPVISNGSMKITSESMSTFFAQADLDTVPVSITIVAALTGVIVYCSMRKCRPTDDQNVLFRRKMVTKNTHLFNSAANKTYNVNTSNDESNCSKYSSKTVQNSSASLYAEIAFGSTETLETSENGYSTVSIGLPKGKYTKDVTESSDTYDTLHTGSKGNTIKTSDCFQSVYDHVIVGNHNNQSTDSDEYSHLHTVQINNLHHIDEDRISDTNSVHCGDQDYQSIHEYDII